MTKAGKYKTDTGGEGAIGAFIATKRQAKGLLQKDLATKLNISVSLLSMLERGSRNPTVWQITVLSDALDLTTEERGQLRLMMTNHPIEPEEVLINDIEPLCDKTPTGFNLYTQMTANLQSWVSGWEKLLQIIYDVEFGEIQKARENIAKLGNIYSVHPVILANINIAHAQIHLIEGELSQASDMLEKVREEVDNWPPNQITKVMLLAEIYTLKSDIQIRRGSYPTARELLNRCKNLYEHVLEQKDESNSLMMGRFGLAKTAKHLAQVHLFRGNNKEAMDQCEVALRYFQLLPPSPTINIWVLKTKEIQAWAFTESKEHKQAIELRSELQEAWKQIGNRYGLARNHLYLADDYRRQMEEIVAPHQLNSNPESIYRRRIIKDNLQQKPHFEEMKFTEQLYQTAYEELEIIGDRLLLGRCLRGRAIILRFLGAFDGLNDENPSYIEAKRLLDEAHFLENSIGQGRRIPSILESQAELLWDWNREIDARDAYQRARFLLEKDEISSDDWATDRIKNRLRKGIATLSERNRLPFQQGPYKKFEGKLAEQYEDLKASINASILAGKLKAVQNSTTGTEWITQLLLLVSMEGQGVFVGNSLLHMLTQLLPAGTSIEAAHLYALLLDQFKESAKAASTPNIEICDFLTVCRDIRSQELRDYTIDQIVTAQQIIKDYPDGFELRASNLGINFPLNFYFKQSFIAVEIPIALASQLLDPKMLKDNPDHTWHFVGNDEELAKQLKDIFEFLKPKARSVTSTLDGLLDFIEKTKQDPNHQVPDVNESDSGNENEST